MGSFFWHPKNSTILYQASGTMGLMGSIPFGHGYNGDLDPYEHDPERKDDEHGVASVCRYVHRQRVTLARCLAVGTPRNNVTELRELIGSISWTEAAHTLLVGIWDSTAACWFCRAVQFQEEQKHEEQKEGHVEDAVPWDRTTMVMECALLIRSVWWCFFPPVCFVALASR
jgi:hypothetical protein